MSDVPLHALDDEEAVAFYADVMDTLEAADVPFLVAGTYAFEHHAGFTRGTKDLDLFIVERHWPIAAAALQARGYATELTFSHWLGKVFHQERFVDFVFAGGNGLVQVTPDWFHHGIPAMVCGREVSLCAAEEIIWSKSFIMERERFDGADVLHMLRLHGKTLDWPRLLCRFGQNWRVLLAHLTLFGYVYPAEQHVIPPWVTEQLMARFQHDAVDPAERMLCRGPLLSRGQYLVDLEEWGYSDPRVPPHGTMTRAEVDAWTDAAIRETNGACVPSASSVEPDEPVCAESSRGASRKPRNL